MGEQAENKLRFCGKAVTGDELSLISQVVERYPNLSRTELANTLCELLRWERPNGKLKTIECRQFLESLDDQSIIRLPNSRVGRPRGSRTRVVKTKQGMFGEPLEGDLRGYTPLSLDLVTTEEERSLWREFVDRYHYLGHRVPFGAHLRYFIRIERPHVAVIGCLQFSSPAWRMQPRDRWIGWDDETRKNRLQRIVNNSRFLILPWVRVRHLASHVLALAARRVPADWKSHYGQDPVLLETLVDPKRFAGTCYRAANWIEVGTTTGRGRQDREHLRHGAEPKTVLLYPLKRDARQRLCRES